MLVNFFNENPSPSVPKRKGCSYVKDMTKLEFDKFEWAGKILGDISKLTRDWDGVERYHVYVKIEEVLRYFISHPYQLSASKKVKDEFLAYTKEIGLQPYLIAGKKKGKASLTKTEDEPPVEQVETPVKKVAAPTEQVPAPVSQVEVPMEKKRSIFVMSPRVIRYVKIPFGGILENPEGDRVHVSEGVHKFAQVLVPPRPHEENDVPWFVLANKLAGRFGKPVSTWLSILDYDPRDPQSQPPQS